MIRVNAKNKIIIISLLFPAAITVLFFFVIAPAVRDINAMSADIETQRIGLEEKYLRGQSLKKLAENLKSISPRIGGLDRIFIDKNGILDFITSLEEAAARNNIAQKINLASEKEAKQNGYNKIPLQIFAEGKFNNLFNYLLEIESAEYYINMASLEFTAAPDREQIDGGENNKIRMAIIADTYWK